MHSRDGWLGGGVIIGARERTWAIESIAGNAGCNDSAWGSSACAEMGTRWAAGWAWQFDTTGIQVISAHRAGFEAGG